METPHDEVKLFEHPLLDELATELGREYVKMLERMNTSLAGVLKHSRGLTKSEGLYIIPGGLSTLEESDLLKAAKPKPKAAPRKKMSEAEAKQKKKAGPEKPGSRGGKWYRDKHGHVRYGTKPEDEERDWEALDDEEVKKLHTNLEAVYGYHPTIRDELNKHLHEHAGLNGDLLAQVFRDAASYGLDIGEHWVNLAADSGVDEADAKEALAQVFSAYQNALNDPKFREKARVAITKRKLEEQHAGEQVKRSATYSDGRMEDILSGNVKDEALRLLALMGDMELLHIPHTQKEASESGDSRADRLKNINNIVPNKMRLEALYSRIDETNGSQLLALYVAQMFRDMREGGVAFKAGVDHSAAEGYFKDGDSYSPHWLLDGSADEDASEKEVQQAAASATDIERATAALHGALFNSLEIDPSKKADLAKSEKYAAKMHELAHEVFNYINAFNQPGGGAQELGLIFTNTVSPSSLFKTKNAAKEMAEKIAEQRKMREDALAAQKNADFATPKGMVAGFKALGQDLLDYQRQALNWMVQKKRGILAFDTGMGKTPMSIAMVAHMRDEVAAGRMKKEDARGIMVMPLGLTKQWPNEIRKFFPDAKVVTIGEDIDGMDNRIKVLEAIQSGKLEADFVILSSSVVNFHTESREALYSDDSLFEEDKEGKPVRKKGVSVEEEVAAKRDIAAGDKMCAALRNLKGCVFFDEAHHEGQGLKTPENVRNAAAREFLKDREHSFLLTATPMPNGKPTELFELMDLIDPGSAGPDAKKFENMMSTSQFNPETGEQEMVGLDDWSSVANDIAPYVFRKSKLDDDVLAANKRAGMDLPKLTGDEGEPGGATHGILPSDSVKKMWEDAGNFKPHDYDERMKTEGLQPWKSLDAIESNFGKRARIAHQQQMLSVTPKLLLGSGDTPESKKAWEKYGYDGSDPKLDHMAGLVKKHFSMKGNENSPIVIFSQWPGAFKHARAALVAQGMDDSLIGEYHGKEDGDDRNAAAEACNAGKIKVLFVGTQAGGAGLNLQKAANKMIFLDQPWMIAHKQQALGRVWRTGQKKPVEVINLYMKGSFDARKLEGLRDKSATDVAMSSAHLDEEYSTQRAQNMFLQVLGGAGATQVENTPDDVLQQRIDAKGLTGLVTPKALKHKFDMEPFSKTLLAREKLEFGQQAIQTKRMLAKLNHSNGETTKEEHARELKRLTRLEDDWIQQNKLAGKEKVARSADAEPIQPEPAYIVTGAKDVKPGDLSDIAKDVLKQIKANKEPLAITDYVDAHLKGEVEKEVERNDKGQPVDPLAHHASVQKWHGQRDAIEKEVQQAFKELERVGAIDVKGAHTPKQSEVPLPTRKETEGKAQGKGGTPSKAKVTGRESAADRVAENTQVNYSGGWNFAFSGEHTKSKEFKKETVKLGGGDEAPLHAIVDYIKSNKKRCSTFEGLKAEFELTDAATKKLIKQMHDHGVIQ